MDHPVNLLTCLQFSKIWLLVFPLLLLYSTNSSPFSWNVSCYLKIIATSCELTYCTEVMKVALLPSKTMYSVLVMGFAVILSGMASVLQQLLLNSALLAQGQSYLFFNNTSIQLIQVSTLCHIVKSANWVFSLSSPRFSSQKRSLCWSKQRSSPSDTSEQEHWKD